MTDHRQRPRYLAPPTTLDLDGAEAAVQRVQSLCSEHRYGIPDAALVTILPILAGAIESHLLAPTQLQMLWHLYYEMLTRLERLEPGLAGATQLDEVAGIDAVEALDDLRGSISDPEWDAVQWSLSDAHYGEGYPG